MKQEVPDLQAGLSLYFCVIPISTTEAFSTAKAIASNVDPAVLEKYYVNDVNILNMYI